jgi:transcriptional regulator of NAD metabolism
MTTDHVYCITKYVSASSVAEALRREREAIISDVCIADSQREQLVGTIKRKPTKKKPETTFGFKPK